MRKALLGMVLLAGSAFAGPGISIGIGFGTPAPIAIARPACPGPGYVWVDGYYGQNHAWVPGLWRRPAVVVAPRSFGYYHRYDAPRNDFRHDDHRNNFRQDDHRNNFRQHNQRTNSRQDFRR
jgi:WXXGXW repeat (2 copies)